MNPNNHIQTSVEDFWIQFPLDVEFTTPGGRLAWTASLVEVRSNEGASYQFTLPRIGDMPGVSAG